MEDFEIKIGNAMGEKGFADLVAAFYQRVRDDELLSPLYPADDWEGAEQRLRDFLIFRFGLSDRYLRERGHPRLRMRHAPFAIGVPERDRWLDLMRQAITETHAPPSIALQLQSFFEQVAEFMRNR